MFRFTLSCALMTAAIAAPLPALALTLTLKTPAAADLPFGDPEFPPGPNVDAINGNCLTCHSVDHVLNQPSLSRASWKEVVEKMVHGYKAPITPEDQDKIVDYLTSIKGVK
jgi:hypothetical protein